MKKSCGPKKVNPAIAALLAAKSGWNAEIVEAAGKGSSGSSAQPQGGHKPKTNAMRMVP